MSAAESRSKRRLSSSSSSESGSDAYEEKGIETVRNEELPDVEVVKRWNKVLRFTLHDRNGKARLEITPGMSVPVKVEGVATWQSPWYNVESIHQQSTVTCIVGRPWLGRETLLGLAKLTERAKQYFEEMPANERILGKGAVVLDVEMLLHRKEQVARFYDSMGVHMDVPADAIFANTYINLDLVPGSEEVRVKGVTLCPGCDKRYNPLRPGNHEQRFCKACGRWSHVACLSAAGSIPAMTTVSEALDRMPWVRGCGEPTPPWWLVGNGARILCAQEEPKVPTLAESLAKFRTMTRLHRTKGGRIGLGWDNVLVDMFERVCRGDERQYKCSCGSLV